MTPEILYVKNMVCHRCVLAVEKILDDLGIENFKVLTGEIHTHSKLHKKEHEELALQLKKIGLELLDDRKYQLIEKTKQLLIEKARNSLSTEEANIKLSEYLTKRLHLEYTYLSNLFSSQEGRSIENYFIHQRIEKVKELLQFTNQTLTMISHEMNYSSVAHLSNQFKQVTGMTPSAFRGLGKVHLTQLDLV